LIVVGNGEVKDWYEIPHANPNCTLGSSRLN
jgi:hypothetical protein